jgi:hypothetical protein
MDDTMRNEIYSREEVKNDINFAEKITTEIIKKNNFELVKIKGYEKKYKQDINSFVESEYTPIYDGYLSLLYSKDTPDFGRDYYLLLSPDIRELFNLNNILERNNAILLYKRHMNSDPKDMNRHYNVKIEKIENKLSKFKNFIAPFLFFESI